MGLSLDALAVLDAIERRGSFAAAALELDRVPSAITYTVRRLEDDLDLLLFDRRGHRARLTPAGQVLVEAGRGLLAGAAAAEQRARRVATGWETRLRIAVDAVIPLARVYPLVAAFYAECEARGAAHTELRIAREVLGGTWDALAEGRADLVLGAPGDPPAGGGYRVRALADVTSVFAVAPTHPLATTPEPLTDAQIRQHRGVVAADTSRRLAPRSVGVLAGQATLTVPDLDAKLAAQVAGIGCGFLPLPLAAAHIAAGRLIERAVETPPPPARANLAWHTGPPGKALAWWLDAAGRADWRFLAVASLPVTNAPGVSSARTPTRGAKRPRRSTA